MGRNTATVVMVLLVMAAATSRVPDSTASPMASPLPGAGRCSRGPRSSRRRRVPTATARAPRVMMLMVRPETPMTVSAVKMDSGMLTAATSVERRLSRNRKMVRTANRAPRRPSRTRPSRDSLMKSAVFEMVFTSMASGCSASIAANAASVASAISTVLAPDPLLTNSVSDGSPLVREKPEVLTSTSSMVATSPSGDRAWAARRRRPAGGPPRSDPAAPRGSS